MKNSFHIWCFTILLLLKLNGVESSSKYGKGNTCTAYDEDPDKFRHRHECCAGLMACERDWLGDGASFTLCVECCHEPCPLPGLTPHIHVYNPNHHHHCHNHVHHGKAGNRRSKGSKRSSSGGSSYRTRALKSGSRDHNRNQEPCAPEEEEMNRNDDFYGGGRPVQQGSQQPADSPVEAPIVPPTAEPTDEPTEEPTPLPTTSAPIAPVAYDSPSATPTEPPTPEPTEIPSAVPVDLTVLPPTNAPSETPVAFPTINPTELCTQENEEPDRTGEYIPCCAGLNECTADWASNLIFYARCVDEICVTGSPIFSKPTDPTSSPSSAPLTLSPTPEPTSEPTTLSPTVTPTTEAPVEPDAAPITSRPSPLPTLSPTYAPTPPPSPWPVATPRPSDPPTTFEPTVDGTLCTNGGIDPFATGVELDCCNGFVSCLGDYAGTGNYSYLCLDSCQDAKVCTGNGLDPYATDVNGTECCSGLVPCLDNWNNDNNHFYLCMETCELPCTEGGLDPWASGVVVPCCSGFDSCLGNWSAAEGDPRFYYLCLESCETRNEFPTIPEPPQGSTPSEKRGIAFREADEALLKALSNAVSWGYTWELTPTVANITIWEENGIDFVPMIWGHNTPVDVPFYNAVALFGFNEPNHKSQSNLEPKQAAYHWKALEGEAEYKNIPILVAPAVNTSPDDWQPVDWLRAFFDECKVLYGDSGCRVDALSVHAYSCTVEELDEYLAQYDEFNLPIWLTEFACVNDEYRLEASRQADYMVDVLPYLESNDKVVKYSWFSYNFTIREDGKISEAALTDLEGGLTPLGEIYSALERTSYESINRSSSSSFGVSMVVALATLVFWNF